MDISKKYQKILDGFHAKDPFTTPHMISFLESMSVGILIINLKSIVLYVNPRYSEITGVRYETIVGRKLNDIRPSARLSEVLKTGRYINNVPRVEGNNRYFADLSPVYLKGQLIGALSILKDIKEAKTISHELKIFENKLSKMKTALNDSYRAKFTFRDIIGQSVEIQKVKQLAMKVSQSDSNLIITGSTGTGKEMFAQAIHNESRRKGAPFVAINCASIPSALIESELFGYEDGAFTGAKKGGKLGLMEIAEGGSLFLDEIENMDLNLQAKLLRVLQERKIRHVGAIHHIDIDVRIIAASNIEIEKLIGEEKFREDLYYRLCVVPIKLPNLLERKGDLPLLVSYFLEELTRKYGHPIQIDGEVYKQLKSYTWPGNIRELENVMKYSIDVSNEHTITVDDLPPRIRKYNRTNFFNKEEKTLKDLVMKVEKQIIKQHLMKYGDSVDAKKIIAKKLGISVATLYNKLKEG